MTTPLEREILTYYWTSPEPFPRIHAGACREAAERFVEMGLLTYDAEKNVFHGVSDALAAYMDALSEVPLPVQKWVVP